MPECLGSFCLTTETIQAVGQGAGVSCVSVLRGLHQKEGEGNGPPIFLF